MDTAPERPLVVPESPVPQVGAGSWRRVIRSRSRRVRTAWKSMVGLLVLAAGVGLVLGFLAARLLGARVGNSAQVTVFVSLTVMLTTAMVMHLLTAGPKQFASDLMAYPGRMSKLVKEAGGAALIHVLFGFAGGTLFTWLLGPWASAALAVGLLVSLATAMRPIIVGGLNISWRWVVRKLAPTNPAGTPVEGMTVSVMGASAAMVLALLVPDFRVRLIIGVVAAGAAVALSLLPRSRGDQTTT